MAAMATGASAGSSDTLFRVVRTMHELLADRGYVVGSADGGASVPGEQYTYEMYLQQFCRGGTSAPERSEMQLFGVRPDGTEQIMVGFCDSPDKKKIGVAPVRNFCERMVTYSMTRGIIVHKQPLSSQAVRVIQQVSEKFRLEAFEEEELVVNITHHTLVPKHEVLSAEAKRALLQRYRLRETQLPRIRVTDPVARYHGLRRGDVVKIYRNSETAGRHITYRLCM